MCPAIRIALLLRETARNKNNLLGTNTLAYFETASAAKKRKFYSIDSIYKAGTVNSEVSYLAGL